MPCLLQAIRTLQVDARGEAVRCHRRAKICDIERLRWSTLEHIRS